MVKNTAAKGRNLELDIKKMFVLLGFESTRAAASHETDVTCMKDDFKVVISAKWLRSYFRPKDRAEILKSAKKAKAIPLLAYKVYKKEDKLKRRGRRCLELCIGESNRVKGVILFLEPLSYYYSHSLNWPVLEDFLGECQKHSPYNRLKSSVPQTF